MSGNRYQYFLLLYAHIWYLTLDVTKTKFQTCIHLNIYNQVTLKNIWWQLKIYLTKLSGLASRCGTKATDPRKLNSQKSYCGTLEENTTIT
jgi:hypothetical protein